MNREQKITFLQDELLKWFEINRRNFPWRKPNLKSYDYIIAEVLLQRTKAETIETFYPIFLQRFPDWNSIDVTTEEDLALFLKPIGLFHQRANRLKKLALEMAVLQGKIPDNKKEIEKLSFMGQYITNSVLLFIQNEPAPLLDVNMARLIERFWGKRKLVDIRHDAFLQELAHSLVNHNKSREINYAVLDFAAIICKSNPKCSECPICASCQFYNSD